MFSHCTVKYWTDWCFTKLSGYTYTFFCFHFWIPILLCRLCRIIYAFITVGRVLPLPQRNIFLQYLTHNCFVSNQQNYCFACMTVDDFSSTDISQCILHRSSTKILTYMLCILISPACLMLLFIFHYILCITLYIMCAFEYLLYIVSIPHAVSILL